MTVIDGESGSADCDEVMLARWGEPND